MNHHHHHKFHGLERDRSMEAQAPVCALADAMSRLPAKLDGLLARHGHTLPRGAEEEIPLIRQDLEEMVALLQDQEHDDSGAMTAKCLAKEVRELSYDVEDTVDQYVHAAAARRGMLSPRRKKYKITRRSSKGTTGLREKLKWRLWMANKIREFSVRSQEALQRYSCLLNHLGENGSSTSPRSDASFGSCRNTPYEEPIGIDAPMKKLEAWLGKDAEQKLKVVSLVGSGGTGKTTLAKELYHRIGGQFVFRAFVRTSRKPDVRRLLITMLSQIRPHQSPRNWKVHNLIADIRTHLQDKRYLIIVDDVWATQTWDIINRALPAGNHCSGILVITEDDDVALKCCGYDSKYVLTMKQLGHEDSSKLFFRTVFGPQYECPPEFSEVGDSIIRKCAGLPLAIVIVASLLVNHMGKTEQWHYVNKSLGYGLKTNPTSEGMKQVLKLSYNNLPQHLKPCVMYLSIYEEDYVIQKDDLVKQWIAEKFIHATEEKDMEGISRSCFDQLISSRMIQPVDIDDNNDVLSCSVHYMVLDFVSHESTEENFVTAIDQYQTTARLADKVRRLSLHFGNAEAAPPTNMRLSQVRTLAFFGVFKCLPSIVEFGLLQVLILHLWGDDESISIDLTGISELFRLRYMHVTCNATLEVPQTQMRSLQNLETLKIDARVSAVPSNIVHLPGLLHLSLRAETYLPNGIGSMTSLCTLGYFDLSVNSIDNVQSLGGLINLRDLRLTCSTVPSSYLKRKMDNMGSILAKLSKLRSVTLEPSCILDSGPSRMNISCDGLSTVSSPPVLLQRFEWLPCICTFSSIPKWIRHLNKLCILKIGVRELVSNDVDTLGELPALTILALYVRAKPAERIVFTNTGFSVLKSFKFRCSVPWLEFQVDSMPNLLKLELVFEVHGVDQHCSIPVGIVHLTCLKEISAKIGGAGANDPVRRAAEAALINAIKMHPARPTFNIQCLDEMFNGRDDNNSGLQEEEVEHMTLEKQYEIMEEDSIEQHGLLQKGSREEAHCKFLAFSDWKNVAEKQPGSSSKYQTGEATGVSSSRIWTRWLKTEAQREQHRNLPKQYAGMEEDSNKQHVALQKDCSEDASRRPVCVRRSMKPKPTWTVFTRNLGDGYSWRKLGQEDISGSAHPRSYYRCSTHTGCKAMRYVQKLDSDPGLYNIMYQGEHACVQPLARLGRHVTYGEVSGSMAGVRSMSAAMSGIQLTYAEHFGEEAVQCTDGGPWLFDITYIGNHTCTPLAMAPLQHGNWQSSISAGVNAARSVLRPRRRKQRELTRMAFRSTCNDGYSWRKLGQKIIPGSTHPRSYYRCVYKDCEARRRVHKLDRDPELCKISYFGEHTCVQSPVMTGSQVAYEEASGSTAGVQFKSAATSSSQITSEEAVQCTDGDPRLFGYTTYKESTPVANTALQHGHEQSSDSVWGESVGSVHELQHRQQREQPQWTVHTRTLNDGFSWHKYDNKLVDGKKHQRHYYKCSYQGCQAKRQVQVLDPLLIDIVHHVEEDTRFQLPATSAIRQVTYEEAV